MPAGVSSPRKEAMEQRKARVRKIILEEGHELSNKAIKERVGVSEFTIAKIRKELEIPAPSRDGGYLSERDFKNRSVKVGSRFPAPVPVEKRASSVRRFSRMEKAAAIRRRKGRDDE